MEGLGGASSSKASTYDETHQPLAEGITAAVQANATWIGVPINAPASILDFACGTGLITAAVSGINPALSFRGLDISKNMAAEYNKRVEALGIADGKAVCADLLDKSAYQPESPVAGPGWVEFDAVFVANSLHHIEKTDLCVARLVERLKVGGVLCVIDWASDDGGSHDHHHHGSSKAHGNSAGGKADDEQELLLKRHGVAHTHGFTKKRIIDILSHNGLEDVDYLMIDKPLHYGGIERKVFIARGKKAALAKTGLSSHSSYLLMH